MGQSRDQIRILESQLLQGELTPDEFETLRDEALGSEGFSDLGAASQDISTPFGEDEDELEIAAGPEVEGPVPRSTPDDLSSLMRPAPNAFDDEEPTDPDSARSADEIEDFTLSMILETQGDVGFDPDLMLADVLAEMEDDEQQGEVLPKRQRPKKSKPRGPSIRALIADLPATLRVLFASTAAVCFVILSLGGLVSTMGADEFGCTVAKRLDTVGVWRLYYENLPVGRCSAQAKEVIRAAGLMRPATVPANRTSNHSGSAVAHHTASAERGVPSENVDSTGLHPLEDPKTRPTLLGAAKIIDDPTVQEPPVDLPGAEDDLATETQSSSPEISAVERADIESCAEGKKNNSVDGWRDYLEHFPVGRCAKRATHFLNTRSPMSQRTIGGIEQRSTSKGPSDFLVDTIVLNDAAVRRCVRVARGRGRDVPTQMGIHFTIHSAGQVSGSRLIAPHLSGTSLDSCISEQVNLLRFPPWDGRDRTITYTLDLRRKATLPKRRLRPVQDSPAVPDKESEEHEAEEEAEAPGGGGGGH